MIPLVVQAVAVTGKTQAPRPVGFRSWDSIAERKTGNRKGSWVELMKQVVEKLDDNDMIALAAYLGSQDP